MGANASATEAERKTIVVLGATGAGKSSVCNLMTDSRFFDESDGFESATVQASYYDSSQKDWPIRVVDTAGFLCTQDASHCREARITQFADLVPQGVDVFILTERFGRFTEANEQSFVFFQELLGPEALKHTVLLFTHVQNRQLQELITQGRLPRRCSGIVDQVAAVVGVECKASPRAAAADLQKAVMSVLNANAGQRYPTALVSAAQVRRQALQSRIHLLRSAALQEELQLLHHRLQQGLLAWEELMKEVEKAEAAEAEKEQAEARRKSFELGSCCWSMFTRPPRRGSCTTLPSRGRTGRQRSPSLLIELPTAPPPTRTQAAL